HSHRTPPPPRRPPFPYTTLFRSPFQNWTRQSSELLGAVELDVDWRVSPADLRTHLQEILATTDLWDGRASVLQVTDAVGGLVRVDRKSTRLNSSHGKISYAVFCL